MYEFTNISTASSDWNRVLDLYERRGWMLLHLEHPNEKTVTATFSRPEKLEEN